MVRVRSRQYHLAAFIPLILFIISKLLYNRRAKLIIWLANQAIIWSKTKTFQIRRCRIIPILKLTCMLKIINWCNRVWQGIIPSNNRARVLFQVSRSRWPKRHRIVSSRNYLWMTSLSNFNRNTSRLMATVSSTLKILYRQLEATWQQSLWNKK